MSLSKLNSKRLEKAPSLATTLVEKLREEIESGRLRVGDRFPTDGELGEAYGVSRTVVREATAVLRAHSLISTLRGRGSIVMARSPSPPFSISVEELKSVDSLIRVNELRISIEVESIALACQRRTDADLKNIECRLEDIDKAIADKEDYIAADVKFHMAIAEATHNEFFTRIFDSIKTVSMASKFDHGNLDSEALSFVYSTVIQEDHRKIVAAIADADVDTAKRLIRRHIEGANERKLLRSRAKLMAG